MPRVVHFEVHADDPERAARFYRQVLSWDITKWDGPQEYWLIRTGPDSEPGINGGMIRRRGEQHGDIVMAFVCTVDVPSVDDYAHRASEAGGQVVVPKMPIPGIGWLVYIKDPEGNIVGLMQRDPKAG